MGVMWGAAWGGSCCGCGWGGGDIYINNSNNFNQINHNRRGAGGNGNWHHNPQHRGGAPYANQRTASQYGGKSRGASAGQQPAGSNRAAPVTRQGAPAVSTADRGAGGGAGGAAKAQRRRQGRQPRSPEEQPVEVRRWLQRRVERLQRKQRPGQQFAWRLQHGVAAAAAAEAAEAGDEHDDPRNVDRLPAVRRAWRSAWGSRARVCCPWCRAPRRTAESPSTAPESQQIAFNTPEAAAEALISAAEQFDVPALKEILGPDGVDLVVSEDPVQDRNHSVAFAAAAREKTAVVKDPEDPTVAILSVGAEEWPLAIPIVEQGGKWRFDSEAGRQETLYRRIGRNELDAIEICRGYVEAQQEYALQKRDGAQVNQYAQRVISTPGKQDGLAWQAAGRNVAGAGG